MKRFAQAVILGFASSPATVFACAVCGAGESDPTRNAFTGSTVFLSFVPLLAIAAVCYTVYRYTKQGDESPSDGQ